MKLAQIATCGAILMALAAHSAAAAPALATKNVNLRQGPGTNFPIITTIPGGSIVNGRSGRRFMRKNVTRTTTRSTTSSGRGRM